MSGILDRGSVVKMASVIFGKYSNSGVESDVESIGNGEERFSVSRCVH